jgi:hypothetical protein
MPFKSQRQRAWMYANKPEMARRWERHTPRGRLPNPVEALEELTGNQMLLVLLGVGVVGGGIYYLATRPSSAPAAPPPPGVVVAPNPTVTTHSPTTVRPLTLRLPQPAWASQVVRPASPGTFGTATPPGPSLTLSPNVTLNTSVPSGQYLTLILPAGATWTGIFIGNSSNPAGAQVLSLGNDTVSPVSIPKAVIDSLNANSITAGWKDSSSTSAHASVLLT